MISHTPSTKPELLRALNRTSIHKMLVKESITPVDLRTIAKEIKDFRGSGAKVVSMILLMEN